MLPYGRHIVGEAEISAVTDALRSEWLTTGPEIERFERGFADFVGAGHAVAVSSGTAALHAAAYVAGIGAGDRAVVPPLTFVASANCVRYQGGEVAFVDVRADTLTLDPKLVAAQMPERCKAVVTVDFAGLPSDLDELGRLAHAHGALLIEDAAHAIGAEYRGRQVGSIADLTVFSLHPVKQMTTGEGGVVTTENDEWAREMRRFRNHGISVDATERAASGSWLYDVPTLGLNYRLTDFQAALGRAQLARVPEWLERRREIAAAYSAAFADAAALELPVEPADRRSGWHLYVVRLRPGGLRVDRAEVLRALRGENIGVNVHYIPVHYLSSYSALGHGRGGWPVAEDAYDRLITLPLWAGMTDLDVEDVIAAVRKVCAAYAAT